MTDRERFAEVADEVVEHFGEVHVLVNNAGVCVFGPTDEATYDDYDWIMGVNFGGVVNGLVSFLPKIKASDGAPPRDQCRQHGRLPARPAGGHLHRQQVRRARADRIACATTSRRTASAARCAARR